MSKWENLKQSVNILRSTESAIRTQFDKLAKDCPNFSLAQPKGLTCENDIFGYFDLGGWFKCNSKAHRCHKASISLCHYKDCPILE